MDNKQNPEIFFHVGLGKVASTYLQYNFFPRLNDIYYIQRTKYKNAAKIIYDAKSDKYLISREFDQQLEREVKDFSSDFPDTKPIILLRRHDSWAASQYRRQVKNGRPWDFKEFIDVENDTGAWKKSDFYFFDKIRILEKYFNNKPLVLFFDEFLSDPESFFKRLVDFMETSCNSKINLSKKHSSYNQKQLKVLLSVCKKINLQKHFTYKSKLYYQFRRIFANLARYTIMYFSYLIPTSMVSKEPLVSNEEMGKIKAFYADDWKKCQDYAARHNPVQYFTYVERNL